MEQFLEAYYPGLNLNEKQTGHKLLRLREHPTAREVQLASNAMALTFHPDKGIFTTWMQTHFKDVDHQAVLKAKMKLAAFWMQVQQTKESLIHFDEGYYQQAPATHLHTHTHQTHRDSWSQNHK